MKGFQMFFNFICHMWLNHRLLESVTDILFLGPLVNAISWVLTYFPSSLHTCNTIYIPDTGLREQLTASQTRLRFLPYYQQAIMALRRGQTHCGLLPRFALSQSEILRGGQWPFWSVISWTCSAEERTDGKHKSNYSFFWHRSHCLKKASYLYNKALHFLSKDFTCNKLPSISC